MVVPPAKWQIFGDRVDVPEAYIPLAPGPHSRAILQRTIDGPSEEERVGIDRDIRRQEAKRQAEMQGLRERHEFLVKFADSPVVSSLLEQHAPHDCQVRFGYTIQECHGCPESYDAEYGESYQSWPCPTWQTISDATP